MSLFRKLGAVAAFAIGAGVVAFFGWLLYAALTAENPEIEYLAFAAPAVAVLAIVIVFLAWGSAWYLWTSPRTSSLPPAPTRRVERPAGADQPTTHHEPVGAGAR